jgi:alkylation response protein AidB-like acyl-CoA dehydrogenase
VPIDGVSVSAVRGIDPAAGYHIARVEHTETSTTTVDATMWEQSLAAGRRAVAHQTAGACRTMLDLACAHARERVQFGRPIARFQAVRHRLADALVAVETLDAALTAAWDEPSPMTAALAKAIAGRTSRTVAAQCQQVLAGIGFTTEHPFHRFLKRTMVLEGILGNSADLVTDVGRGLLATRFVPTLIEL